jgi:hypothetical protein
MARKVKQKSSGGPIRPAAPALDLCAIRAGLDRLRQLITNPPIVKTHCTVDGRLLSEEESPTVIDDRAFCAVGLGMLRLLCPSGFTSVGHDDTERDIDAATALPRAMRIALRKLAAFCRRLVEDASHSDAVHAPDESLALLDEVAAALSGPPLTDTERAVLAVIPRSPRGCTGKEIIAALAAAADGTELQQSTLTRHIIPRLKKWHGVTNRPHAGYCRP